MGEVLLGMKFSESGASESLKEKPDITVDCGLMGGQLQVSTTKHTHTQVHTHMHTHLDNLHSHLN